jgi:hypothetical protein
MLDSYLNTRELLARLQQIPIDKSRTLSPPLSTSGSTTESDAANSVNIDVFRADPSVDKSPKLSETELAKQIQKELPNLPIVYWQENKNKKLGKNSTCAKFPSVYDLKFNNKYWQVTETTNGTFHLYGAYLDVRAANRLGPTVRILGMINRLEPKVGLITIKIFGK